MQIAISLYGFGNVGREFVRLLNRKMPYLKSRHGIEPRVVSIVTRRGGVRSESGIDWPVLVNLANAGTLSEQEGFVGSAPDDLGRWLPPEESGDIRVLVDATWSDLITGEPSLSRLKEAARRGCHLITLNKAPIVADFDGMVQAAREARVRLKFSGATAAGLPTIDTVRVSLAGAEVHSIEGVLNSTTNYILTSMSDNALSYEEALRRSQALGLAETDPERDVSGIDTACKILILANAAMGARKRLSDVKVTGITEVTSRQIAYWAVQGRTLRLIGRAVRAGDDVSIEVKPTPVPYRDFLAQVTGDSKGVRFTTDIFGELTIVGGAGGPSAAASSALKDLVNLARAVDGDQGLIP